MATIFIDGQAGTTGLEITQRLAVRDDIELIELDDAQRKDPAHRKEAMLAADISILCLPDDAARESVELAGGKSRFIDASTAHRTDPAWIYGLPELTADQREQVGSAQFVSNPGCYPQGFILLVRPLIEAQLLSSDLPLFCYANSGFSGGGRQMIERYCEAPAQSLATRPYALTLSHKHVPEMQAYSLTSAAPIFVPNVGDYYKGMTVHVPLFAHQLEGTLAQAVEVLTQRYADEPFVRVIEQPMDAALDNGFLDPTGCNDSNRLELMIFGNDEQLLLTARYDNLGKGASGAAVQCLNLMLGQPETTGLAA